MKFELEPHNRNASDAEMLDDLKRVASELSKTTVTGNEYNKRGRFHCTTLMTRFGSWNKALEQAGLTKTKNQNIPNEDLFKNLAEIWTKLGRQPFISDICISEFGFSSAVVGHRPTLQDFALWSFGCF
ncbi:MAG TPA: hypothetical protein VE344_05120 [Methylomirabilota bacterium]|nr:hypothetical protein [Methylomirabilota bacterium]